MSEFERGPESSRNSTVVVTTAQLISDPRGVADLGRAASRVIVQDAAGVTTLVLQTRSPSDQFDE